MAGRSYSTNISNISYEIVEQFRYLGTKLTNQNCIQEEIKSSMMSGNACYHSVQNVLCSVLIYKNINIKIYRTKILFVILYECETWSLTLVKERRLRVFEKRLLEYLSLRRTRQQGRGESYIMRNLMICTAHHYFSSDKMEKNGMGVAFSTCGRDERCIQGFSGET